MAAAKERLFNAWSDVPNDSTLLVSVKGTKTKKLLVATIDGLEMPPTGPATPIPGILDTATGKPMPIELTSPNIYAVDINLLFMSEATAVVHAHIEDRNGNLVDAPFDTKVSRKKGVPATVVLSIGMRKGKAK